MGDRAAPGAACCPRCGYDLRGTLAAWSDSCPLAGTCAECGVGFEWREVLSPKMRRPAWCVEYAKGLRDFLRRSVATAARTLWPFGFWRSLGMSDPLRWRALACYLALGAGALYVAFCIAHGALAWAATRPTGAVADAFRAALLPLSGTEVRGRWVSWSPRELLRHWDDGAGVLLLMLLFHALCAAGFAVLPVSRRRAKVRWGHILRVWAYGMGLVAPAVLFVEAGIALAEQDAVLLALAGTVLLALAGLWAPFLVGAEVVWWSTATGRYLRMGHPWGVGAAVVAMALLAALAAAFYVSVYT